MAMRPPGIAWSTMPQGVGHDASFRHQLAVLRRRWPLVVLVAVVAGGTAAGLTVRRAPVYEAKAAILLQPKTDEQLLANTGGGRAFTEKGNEAETEIEVMQSETVHSVVRSKLGRDPKVEIEIRGATDVLDIRARSTDPVAAAAEATTFAEVYVELRRTQRVEDVLKTGELIRAQLLELDKKLDELERPLRELDARLGATTNTLQRPQLEQQRRAFADDIAAERRALESRRSSLDEQLNRLQLLSGLGTSGGVQLVSKAEVPTQPVSASPLRNAGLGLLGGLVMGLGVAFLLDQFDDRLRHKEELEAGSGVPVLGFLPMVTQRRAWERVVAFTSPSSPTAEAYRTLRTSLQFMGIDRPIGCLQVTSPTSAEGKTTVVTNLAASFAQAGQRVIVLDCDLRRSQVHERFGVSNKRGFTSVLLAECVLADVVITLEDEPFLAVVPAGPAPPNPSELLTSPAALAILNALRKNCDILIVDSPPVLPVTDALVIAGHVDATLLVARAKRTTRRQVARARELLDQVGAPLVGTVLNGVADDAGGYGYSYVYATDTPKRLRRGQRRRGEL